MKSIIVHAAAAALLAAALAPAALAQATRSAAVNPYVSAGRAPVCTPLERSVGLTGDECGQLTPSEIAALKMDRDSSN